MDKRLIFNILSLIVFEGGISNKSINDILISLGKVISTYYVTENLKINLSTKIEVLVANELYTCLETVLIDQKSLYIVRSSFEKKNAILERSDTKITSETYLSVEFKKLLQLSNEIIENKSLFLKPLEIDLKCNQIGLHFSD